MSWPPKEDKLDTQNYQFCRLYLMFYILVGLAITQDLTVQNTGILGYSADTLKVCAYSTFVPGNLSSFQVTFNSNLNTLLASNDLLKFIDGIFKGNGVSLTSLTANIGNYATSAVLLFAYLIAPLVIFLLTFPFLVCCCLCPKCCPSACCRSKDLQETACTKYWPSIFLLVTVTTMVGTGIASLVNSRTTIDSVGSLQCQAFKSIDTVTLGRISNNNSTYFIGVKPAVTKLGQLKTSLNQINTRSAGITPAINTVQSAYSTFQTNIANNYASFNNPTYTNAFYQSDGTTALSVSSIMKQTYLGPQTSSGTVYYILSTFMKTIHDVLNPALNQIKNGISYLTTNLATVSTFIDQGKDSINSIGSILPTNLASMAGGTTFLDYGYYGLLGLSLVIFLFGLITVVSVILFTFFNSLCCKHCIKFMCFLGWIFFLIFFIIALVLSILTPASYVVCNNYDSGLINNKAQFQKLFSSFLGSSGSSLGILSQCITGGDLSSAIGGDFKTSTGNLNGITNNTQNFQSMMTSSGFTTSGFSTAKGAALSIIVKLQNNQIYDITNSDALNHLSRLSQGSYSTAGCNSQISSDSWVPNSQNTVNSGISCKSGVAAKTSNCSSLAVGGCSSGCFSFTKNLGTVTNDCAANTAYNCTPTANVQSQLQGRYGVVGSCAFSNLINKLNSNWDASRQSNLKAFNDVMNAGSGGFTAMDNYQTSVNNVVTSFSSLNTYITSLSTVLGSKTGIFSGLNCKAFNQQLNNFFGSYCKGFYPQITSILVALTVTIYALAFSLICMICVTNRQEYRESLNNQVIDDKFQQVPAGNQGTMQY